MKIEIRGHVLEVTREKGDRSFRKNGHGSSTVNHFFLHLERALHEFGVPEFQRRPWLFDLYDHVTERVIKFTGSPEMAEERIKDYNRGAKLTLLITPPFPLPESAA